MTPRNPRDRGETTTQVLVVTPVVVMLLLTAIQISIHAHVAHVATAVAAHGAATAATPESTRASADRAVRQLTADLGSRLASSPVIGSSGGSVSVRVEVVVPRVIPLFPPTVTREVVEPKERLLREWER